jgi:phage-related protein
MADAVGGGGAGLFQQLGIIFNAQDLASPVAEEAQRAVEATSDELENSFASLTTTIDSLTETAGEAMTTVEPTLAAVVADVEHATKSTSLWESALTVASRGLYRVQAALGTANAGLEQFEEMTESVSKKGGVFGGLAGGVGALSAGIRGSLGGSGLLGFILGPIAPLLTLLTPLINIVEKVLEPAFDILGGAVENAFAPLGEVAATVAGELAPVIQKFMAPFVDLLISAAVQAGAFLQELAEGAGPSGGLGGFSKAFAALMPILGKLVGIFAGALIGRLQMFLKIAEEVGPLLIETAATLLKALMPVIEAATKLGTVLLEKVFAPLLINAIKGIAMAIELIAPELDEVGEWFGKVIDGVTDKVSDFFGNLGKYWDQFDALFIQPIMEGIDSIVEAFALHGVLGGIEEVFTQIWEFLKTGWSTLVGWFGEMLGSLLDLLGLTGAGESVRGIFQAIQAAILSPLETIKAIINTGIIDTLNSFLSYDLPVIGPIKDIKALGLSTPPISRLEAGGIVEGGKGGTLAQVGEGKGNELVMPLSRETVQETVGPLLGGVEMPAMQEVVEALHSIHQTIERAVDRMMGQRGPAGQEQAPAHAADDRQLGMALGISGFGA